MKSPQQRYSNAEYCLPVLFQVGELKKESDELSEKHPEVKFISLLHLSRFEASIILKSFTGSRDDKRKN